MMRVPRCSRNDFRRQLSSMATGSNVFRRQLSSMPTGSNNNGLPNQQRNRMLWSGFVSFSVIVLSAQIVRTTLENRKMKQHIDHIKNSNDCRLETLHSICSEESIRIIAERLEQEAQLQNRSGNNPTAHRKSHPIVRWCRSNKTTVEPPEQELSDQRSRRSEIYTTIIQQELNKMIKQNRNLHSLQIDLFDLSALNKTDEDLAESQKDSKLDEWNVQADKPLNDSATGGDEAEKTQGRATQQSFSM